MTADPRVEAVAEALRSCYRADEPFTPAALAPIAVAALDAYAEGSDLALMVQRERIAQAIDAEAFDRAHAVHDPQCADCAAIAALTLAARIARGQS
jgi:hypothetical protein